MSDSLRPHGPHQAPSSMEFSRQEYWSGLPYPSPGNLTNPGIEPRSPALQADAGLSESSEKPQKSENHLMNLSLKISFQVQEDAIYSFLND